MIKYIHSLTALLLFTVNLGAQCDSIQIALEPGCTLYYPYDEESIDIDTNTMLTSEIVPFHKSDTAKRIYIDYPSEVFTLPIDLILEYGSDGLEIEDFYIHENPNLVKKGESPCRHRIYYGVIYQVDQNNLTQFKYMYYDYKYEPTRVDPFVDRKKKKKKWTKFKKDLINLSESAFSTKYNESEIVKISRKREKLPDFLKKKAGPASDKFSWFYNNIQDLDKY